MGIKGLRAQIEGSGVVLLANSRELRFRKQVTYSPIAGLRGLIIGACAELKEVYVYPESPSTLDVSGPGSSGI